MNFYFDGRSRSSGPRCLHAWLLHLQKIRSEALGARSYCASMLWRMALAGSLRRHGNGGRLERNSGRISRIVFSFSEVQPRPSAAPRDGFVLLYSGQRCSRVAVGMGNTFGPGETGRRCFHLAQLLASQETTKRFLGACDACHNNISGRNRPAAPGSLSFAPGLVLT